MEKSSKLVSEIGQIAQLLCIFSACKWHTKILSQYDIFFANEHTVAIKTVDLAETDRMVVYLFLGERLLLYA